jgi:hypothetical protein
MSKTMTRKPAGKPRIPAGICLLALVAILSISGVAGAAEVVTSAPSAAFQIETHAHSVNGGHVSVLTLVGTFVYSVAPGQTLNLHSFYGSNGSLDSYPHSLTDVQVLDGDVTISSQAVFGGLGCPAYFNLDTLDVDLYDGPARFDFIRNANGWRTDVAIFNRGNLATSVTLSAAGTSQVLNLNPYSFTFVQLSPSIDLGSVDVAQVLFVGAPGYGRTHVFSVAFVNSAGGGSPAPSHLHR